MRNTLGCVAFAATCALIACTSDKASSDQHHPGTIVGGGDTSAGAGGAAAGPAANAAGAGAAGSGSAGNGAATDPAGNPIPAFEAQSVRSYVRKVKNLLTGLAPTEEEFAAVERKGPAGCATGLIDGWTSADHPETYDMFRSKMIGFFVNAFEQTGFTPTEDFKPQLLENAGFDLGPLGVYGDDAFPRLVQNLQESFARTACEIVAAGKPFTDVLTTRELMMTTALMSLYVQIEMPNDQPFNFSFGMMQPTSSPGAWT